MSHVPTVLKSDRSVFDKMLPVDDNDTSSLPRLSKEVISLFAPDALVKDICNIIFSASDAIKENILSSGFAKM